MNPMNEVQIEKVTINIGVGEAGEKLSRAINLLEEILHEENYGVVLLTSERYKKRCIVEFVKELRKKYMGDLIEIDLSKDKPIQLLPFLYSSDVQALIKKHNFFVGKRILEYLTEINIYIEFNIH